MLQTVTLIQTELPEGLSALSVFSALMSDEQVIDSFLFENVPFVGANVNKKSSVKRSLKGWMWWYVVCGINKPHEKNTESTMIWTYMKCLSI